MSYGVELKSRTQLDNDSLIAIDEKIAEMEPSEILEKLQKVLRGEIVHLKYGHFEEEFIEALKNLDGEVQIMAKGEEGDEWTYVFYKNQVQEIDGFGNETNIEAEIDALNPEKGKKPTP